ncbi:MAG: hypothetical protein GX130_01885 [Candidatus Hydrogenedens sp.]|jgi:hypothetical protein|nr:hypothetical protein [Candidatus Hydrogenedens sp.]
MTDKAMNRRHFLQSTTAGIGLAACVAKSVQAVTISSARKSDCRYWLHGLGGDDLPATAAAMKESGFHRIVANGAAAIEAVNGAGMEAWMCGGGFPLIRKEDSLRSVDIFGQPQDWFGSGSPCAKEVREASLENYRKMVEQPGIKGILVDGVRFSSPASGLLSFLTDFSVHAEELARELGMDFDLMKRDVTRLYEFLKSPELVSRAKSIPGAAPAYWLEELGRLPGLSEWLRFRRICSTQHFRALAEIIHGAGLKMGVYIFTPSLAPLVGQSYADLTEFVDVFAPMIYRNYPDHPGPACLNWELAAVPDALAVAGEEGEIAVMEAVLSLAGFADLMDSPTVAEVQKALPPAAVARETSRARALIGEDRELAPIIYIDDPLMAETAAGVRAAGADGVNFFVYKEQWKEMTAPALG